MQEKIQKKPLELTAPALLSPEEPIEQSSEFLTVLHGKATDAIARMSGSKPTPNPLNNTASIESGEVKPTIYKVLPITEAEAAQDILYRGENVGKVVLTVE